MKLKNFKAKNVFGYMDFDINFNDDITLLYGMNGNGKTTALKLIQMILTPSFKDFHSIKFEELKLSYTDNQQYDNKTIRVEIKKDTIEIYLKIYISNKKEYEFIIPLIDEEELEYLLEKDESYFNEFLIDNRQEKLIEFLTAIKQPLFLGLDRRNDGNINIDFQRDIIQRRIFFNEKKRRKTAIRRNRFIKGSLGISLMESELLVQDTYRRIRALEDKQRDKLRDELLMTSFDYIDLKNVSFTSINKPDYLSKILKRKEEIIQNLSSLGNNATELLKKTDSFFQKLTELKEKSETKNKDESYVDIELITNKVQIDRMEKLIKTIDEHKSKVDKYFEPINKFLNIINKFFEKSNKSIEIDTVGHIRIQKPNKFYDSIEALSSGERQLIIIFIHLIFETKGSKVFIIDEPELSLHIQWQSMFTDAISEISPKTQFILATHSPEIVEGYENKATAVRKNNAIAH